MVCRKDVPPFSMIRIEEKAQIKLVGAGVEHYIAVTTSGRVFSWGEEGVKLSRGQSGLGHLDVQKHPKVIEVFEDMPVKEVICGGYHTFVICEGGEIYCWGYNKHGQLGLLHNENQ